jgi:hypothetical protein
VYLLSATLLPHDLVRNIVESTHLLETWIDKMIMTMTLAQYGPHCMSMTVKLRMKSRRLSNPPS